MPKRIKDKNRSIFVKFYQNIPEEEVREFLGSLNLEGFRSSTLINRWVLEVPFWKENFYLEKLYQSEIIEQIHENLNKKIFFNNQEEGEQTDE